MDLEVFFVIVGVQKSVHKCKMDGKKNLEWYKEGFLPN